MQILSLNILSSKNSAGLEKDLNLLSSTLKESDVLVTESSLLNKTLFFAKYGRPSFDMNIFCERVEPLWFRAAKKNILIPNQEIVGIEFFNFKDKIDAFLCKTKYAFEIFKDLDLPAFLIGFTGEDHYREDVKKEKICLHVAGKSPYKGTQSVIDCWRANPDFPELIIVQYAGLRKNPNLKNVTYVDSYLSYEELITLQNKCEIHICCSEIEGWGHYILEALSCKSLVLTTDAPPMNELVTPERGLLVPYSHASKEGLGSKFHVDEDALAVAVKQALSLSKEEIQVKQNNARAFFESNDRLFRKNLINTLNLL